MPRRRSPADESEINITPMLDVVFIMLIFFIVTTSFVKDTGLEVNRPEAVGAEEKPLGNILIGVSESGRVWMQKRRVNLAQVRQLVERARAESPEASVVIISDTNAPTGAVVDVMEQVGLAGVSNIAIAAEQGSGP